jgi:hypothetical protein
VRGVRDEHGFGRSRKVLQSKLVTRAGFSRVLILAAPSDTLPPAVPDSTDPHAFDFDLDGGIRDQVVRRLESSPLLPLGSNVGPQTSGIYALYFKKKLVYIGKASKGTTKSKRTLRARLNEHVGKIGSRKGITPGQVTCRYLTFASEWWVFAAEFALMTHYQPEWNASGFGSKVPGVGRPGTHRVSRWDELFP